jgi:hypothetical protein
MKNKFLILSLLTALIASSCNLPEGGTPTEAPILFTATPAPPTDTPLPTNTPLPTDTQLPTLTFTPSVSFWSGNNLDSGERVGRWAKLADRWKKFGFQLVADSGSAQSRQELLGCRKRNQRIGQSRGLASGADPFSFGDECDN